MAENKGTWIDNKTGKLVTSQPEEGVQVVSPNVEPTPADEAAVEAAKAALADEAPASKATTSKSAK